MLLEAGFPVETVAGSSCDVVDKLLLSVKGSKLEILVVSDFCADGTPLKAGTVERETMIEGDDSMVVDRAGDNEEKTEDVGKVEEEDGDDDDDREDGMDCDCELVIGTEPEVGPITPYIDEVDTVTAL